MAEDLIERLKRRVDEQRRVLGSLASSLDEEGGLDGLMRRVDGQCRVLESLASGDISSGGFVLNWPESRDLFVQYLQFKRYEPRNARNLLGYLDRLVKQPIKAPVDVMQLFSPLTAGQRHHLNRALRAWFNCLEINRPEKEFKDFLDALRRAIPKDEVGVDINVPDESQIVSDMRRLSNKSLRGQAAYNLLLDSGLRLVEVSRLLSSLPETEKLEGFYRCPVGLFRGSKQAYYCYMTEYTYQLVKRVAGASRFSDIYIAYWFRKHDFTRPKYIRKFVNDTMTSEKLNIPESVADFIQGRVPKTIGAKHYMQLKRKADQYYPRYAQYITELRQKAGILN